MTALRSTLGSTRGTRRLRLGIVALLAAFLIGACTTSEERGGTYITFDADSCAFTINLRMAFWGPGATAAQSTQWTKAINDFWNGKDMKVGDCPLKVVAPIRWWTRMTNARRGSTASR